MTDSAFVVGVVSLNGSVVGINKLGSNHCEQVNVSTTVSGAKRRSSIAPSMTAFPYTGSGYGSAGVPYAGDTVGYKATGSKSIVDTAIEAGVFKTLVSLLVESGLEYELQKGGPFTVFAPTDDAFAALLEPHGFQKLGALVRPENTDSLRKILAHHVVRGNYTAASLMDRAVTVDSLAGEPITLMGFNKMVSAGSAKVVKADVMCSNGGIIHAVSSVLVPTSFSPPSPPQKPAFPASSVLDVYAALPTPREALGIDAAPGKLSL
eukprot:CAMPEP_0182446402 /NCGR_PEP_ID=MMETSP1172-20130603/4184_1 /TAXON_ID=708627 /ORGANISM="Timspurckia oligopyrenoides, Strain CCMP3278" /LENGTH=263 /DNA_ID=CAMNT_0024642331 /DNA_START=68 /DNA_END=859 /DNA_ORIENTATION=-